MHSMRFIIATVLILLLSAVAEYVFSWWSLAIVAFAIAFMMKLRPGKAFLAGFLGIAILWCCWTLALDMPNDHLLAGRLAGVFNLPGYWPFIIIVTLVGGITGGMASWSGALVRRSVYGRYD